MSRDAPDGAVGIGLIWAQSDGGVIGQGGVMPWHLPEDLAHFKQVTLGSPVVMGRKTWDSLPERFRPLPGRANIVVTRDQTWHADGATRVHSVDEALALAEAELPGGGEIWVIGGAQIFDAVIDRADQVLVTEIQAVFDGDTVAPSIGDRLRLASSDPAAGWHTSRTGLEYRFLRYEPR